VKTLRFTFWLSCLLIPLSTAHADPWGRLFTTPAQRSQLDAGQVVNSQVSQPSDNDSQAIAPRPIRITGTLTSSSGKHTVWLNGKPARQGVRVLEAGRVQLRVTSSASPRRMKSGQLLYPKTGKVVEGYAARPSTLDGKPTQAEPKNVNEPM